MKEHILKAKSIFIEQQDRLSNIPNKTYIIFEFLVIPGFPFKSIFPRKYKAGN